MALCREVISSEGYADFIVEFGASIEETLRRYENFCIQLTGYRYAIIYVDRSKIPPISIKDYTYYAIPKMYGLTDTTAAAATGALQLQRQTGLNLTGRGVIVGFIDTGIDYTNKIFQDSTGNTRILRMWDQTDNNGTPPFDLQYGSEYLREDIDTALKSENPYDTVPQKDTNGHGTFMAGVACGSSDIENDFVGTAPESDIVVVKLKPAKQYLKEFFLIEQTTSGVVSRNQQQTEVFQENDIMLGLSYLRQVAVEERKPLIVVLGIGTGSGDHAGGSPLAQMINNVGQIIENCAVVASGNEGNARLHYRGMVKNPQNSGISQIIDNGAGYQDVEIKVSEGNKGFVLEVWGDIPDLFSISFISPSGESVPRIPARIGETDRLTFILEKTVIDIDYSLVESGSGGELIFLRFIEPSEGIWTIRVYATNILSGKYDIWFNLKQFVHPETYFISPDPEVTLVIPSSTRNVITIGGYDNKTNSIYVNTGRGNTRTGETKPDLVAPAVEVYGPTLNRTFTRKTGTSVAAALVAGNCAQMMQWGVVDGNHPEMRTAYIKNYLIRGAVRDRNIIYPDTQWGYGKVNAYDAFTTISR